MPKGLLADRIDILLDLYGFFITHEAGPWITASEFKRRAGLRLSTSYISLVLEGLEKQGDVEADVGDHDTNIYTLTEAGVLSAEKEVLGRGLTLDEFEAAFRQRADVGLIANVSPNDADINAAKQALSELEQRLNFDNDLGLISEEEKQVGLEEVRELQETISKPTIRLNYLWAKANEVLIWIVEKGGGAAVGEVAKAALRHIHQFINAFFN
jgi:DNA-binding PadR family transcriptional regulator